MSESVKEVPMWDCIFRIQRRTSWAARLEGGMVSCVRMVGEAGGEGIPV